MKVRNLDLILEQCINEADFEEADMDLRKLHKLCEEALGEGATAAVTIYFDHDPKHDHVIKADLDTDIHGNKIILKNITIADYYDMAFAQDGGYIQFEEDAMKEAFVYDYNNFSRNIDDPEITVEQIESIHLNGYEEIPPVVYGAGSWVGVSCPEGTTITWDRTMPTVELCATIHVIEDGKEERRECVTICNCDAVYHPSPEACMIIDDVEAAQREQFPDDYYDAEDPQEDFEQEI
jgi:hypothetical protein